MKPYKNASINLMKFQLSNEQIKFLKGGKHTDMKKEKDKNGCPPPDNN